MDDTGPDKLNWRNERVERKMERYQSLFPRKVFFLGARKGKRKAWKKKKKKKKKKSQGRTHLWRFP
jgi:hypothetical protein